MLSKIFKNNSGDPPNKNWFFEFFICFVVIFCCVGTQVPGINESHYLPKAKSMWDESYAMGGDLFLDSGNSHWLASLFAGQAARHFELASVAWLGRAAAWLFLALAWIRFCRATEIPSILRPVALLGWFLLNHYGNWAGEWFVGGYEAKSFSYPCVLMGLSNAITGRWRWTWVWMGAAVAWHPVVGGWAGITLALLWLLQPDRLERFAREIPGIAIGFGLGLIGVAPALAGIGASASADGISASQVHVYYRLPHHLAPHMFSANRHLAACAVLAWLVIATLLSRDSMRSWREFRPIDSIMIIAWFSVAISVFGLAIDLAAINGLRHDWAAGLLRFYFFRWSDVIVPLAIVVALSHYLADSAMAKLSDFREVPWQHSLRIVLIIWAVAGIGVWHWAGTMMLPVPPADLSLIHSVGPAFSATDAAEQADMLGVEQLADPNVGTGTEFPLDLLASRLPQRYLDWLAVCEWIREQTPEDSLWFTPRYQQTFKWYTSRAEVVNWKDVPQDNASIIEWYRRVERCKMPRDSSGKPRGWTTDELIELAREYNFQWVLIDRSFQPTPPLLECKYPVIIENRSFAVFHIPENLIQQSAFETKSD